MKRIVNRDFIGTMMLMGSMSPCCSSGSNSIYASSASSPQRERREEPDLVRRSHLCADCYRQEGTEPRRLALHLSTDSVGLDLRENRDFMRPSATSIPHWPIGIL